MSNITYRYLYEVVSSELKRAGFKVRHVREMNDLSGYIRISEKKIIMSGSDRATKYGLVTLCHEVGHYMDCVEGKYPDFYKDSKYYDPELILAAEHSAYVWAKNFLVQFKPALKDFPMFSKKHLRENYLGNWLKIYNKTN